MEKYKHYGDTEILNLYGIIIKKKINLKYKRNS